MNDFLKHTSANDGVFFIPFENYLKKFALTSVCVTAGDGLAVSRANYSSKRTQFYEFTLSDEQKYLCLTVNQQGPRLENIRPVGKSQRFVPSPFSCVLIDDTDKIVKHTREMTTWNLHHSFYVSEKVIPAGRYTLIIDVDWHESASYNEEYKNVLLRVFTGQKVHIKEID